MSCETSSNSLWDLRRAIGMCKSASVAASPALPSRAKGRTSIELIKKEGSPLGLTISGGVDKDGKPRVAQLKQGSIAQKADVFDIGDALIGINQSKTAGLKHEQVIELIKQAGEQITFEIEYDLPKWPIHPLNTVHTRTIQIQLEKEGQSYGFLLRGGEADDPAKNRPLIITKIRAQGPADKEGTIKIGDRVLAINGINVSGSTLQNAYNIIRQCRGTTLFLIEYDVAIVDSVKHATGSLLIEIEKSPGTGIGLTLGQKWIRGNRSIIVIESVKPASIADRCGALHCGDQINAIDQKSFLGLSLAEANIVLRSCTGDFCRIEVTPVCMLAALNLLNEPPQIQQNRDSVQMRLSVPARKSLQKTRHSSINLTSSSSLASNPSSSSVMKMTHLRGLGSLNSSYQSVMGNQMCHTETMECLLRLDALLSDGIIYDGEASTSYGFTLQSVASSSDILLQPPIIGYLETGSVAERSGVLQIGDRVLAINGQVLEGITLEDARSLIKDSNNQLHMEIEFDVADSVMLSSGICQVKLLRKGLDLGLSVTYSRSSRTDEIPIISHVKRGSIAHRCGMIQPGDHLLSIDTNSLRGKSLNEIVSLLKNTDEIVRLRIKKDDHFSEDNLSENHVVYKVQLVRQGGPLGLTISGSEDVFEPIVVSDLCEGGLAERTNAIHVGDRILAINDVSLRGKSLHEAIELLQTSGDEITLKISRTVSQQPKDYTPSVDSAMESWDSSNGDHHETNNKETISSEPSTSTVNDFFLKPQHRSTLFIPPSTIDRRTPPILINNRPLELLRHSESKRSNPSDTKYDNYSKCRSQLDRITVVLKRDKRVLDFGFSISDRLYGTGVYVNKIRANGPAELEGTLIPCMRIYKVNQIDVTRMECHQVVPLLSSSPDDLILVVGRRAAPMFDETDEFIDLDQDDDKHPSSSSPMTISTL